MNTSKIIIAVLFLPLLAATAWAGEVEVEQLAKSTTSWNGTSLPDCGDQETEVTVLRITVPPQTRLPMHFHPVINVAYMLEGELTVIGEDGNRTSLVAGDSLIELVNQNHYGVNEGDGAARLVVVYIGQEGGSITVKQ